MHGRVRRVVRRRRSSSICPVTSARVDAAPPAAREARVPSRGCDRASVFIVVSVSQRLPEARQPVRQHPVPSPRSAMQDGDDRHGRDHASPRGFSDACAEPTERLNAGLNGLFSRRSGRGAAITRRASAGRRRRSAAVASSWRRRSGRPAMPSIARPTASAPSFLGQTERLRRGRPRSRPAESRRPDAPAPVARRRA